MIRCRMCETKRARVIDTPYKYATREATFCSQRCAAHYGLIQASFNDEYFCERCGRWTQDCEHRNGYEETE